MRVGLKECHLRKTPFLKPVHLEVRPEFTKSHIDNDAALWKQVLWSDETKIEFFDHNSVSYVYRKSGEGFLPKKTISTVNHGGGSLMFWVFFADSRPGRLVKVTGIMKKGGLCSNPV